MESLRTLHAFRLPYRLQKKRNCATIYMYIYLSIYIYYLYVLGLRLCVFQSTDSLITSTTIFNIDSTNFLTINTIAKKKDFVIPRAVTCYL